MPLDSISPSGGLAVPGSVPPPEGWWSKCRTPAVLGGCGLMELAACFYGAHAQNRRWITTSYAAALVQGIPYLAACWWVIRNRLDRRGFRTMIALAVVFRLVALLGTQPYLSTDVYRYVWDGRVQGAGINPYRYVSSDPHLTHLRDAGVYARMNRPDARTIYPPGAELIFYGVTRLGDHALVMRGAMVGFEAVAVWALCGLLQGVGLRRDRVLLYAWHPLPIWEFAGSGHVDAVVVATVALALWAVRRGWAGGSGLALSAATLVKLFPVVLLPALYRRWDWKLPLVLAGSLLAVYALYAGVGLGTMFDFLLHGYTHEEGIDSGERFFLVALANHLLPFRLPVWLFKGAVAMLLGSLAVWACWRDGRDNRAFIRRAAVLATAFTVLLSPGYSWYFSWLVVFLPFLPRPSLFWLTLTSFVLYANWLHNSLADFFVIQSVQYLPALGLLALEAGWSWRRQNSVEQPVQIAG